MRRYRLEHYDATMRGFSHSIAENIRQRTNQAYERLSNQVRESQAIMLAASVQRPRRDLSDNEQNNVMISTAHPEAWKKTSQAISSTKSKRWISSAHSTAGTQLPLARTCSLSCSCKCHRVVNRRQPSLFKDLLGWLMAGSYFSSWSTQACDTISCRKRYMRYAYLYSLPGWLMDQRKLLVIMTYFSGRGPEFCLRFPRVRPYITALFIAAHNGSLSTVRQALEEGTASVIDIDPYGETALHVRLPIMEF